MVCYESPGEIKSVALYKYDGNAPPGNGSLGYIPFRGTGMVGQLPGERIFYTCSETEKYNDRGKLL